MYIFLFAPHCWLVVAFFAKNAWSARHHATTYMASKRKRGAELAASTSLSYSQIAGTLGVLNSRSATNAVVQAISHEVANELDITTSYGKVLQSMSLPTATGGEFKWLYMPIRLHCCTTCAQRFLSFLALCRHTI